MAELARRNVAANGLADAIEIVTEDLLGFRAEPSLDHAFANPPWHEPSGTPSPLRAKEDAKRAMAGGVARWIAALAMSLRRNGTVTIVMPATCLPECLEALGAARCGSASILPLWPRPGREAKLVIVQATKDGRGPCRLLPGLTLHGEDGFTPEAAAILRDGLALPLG